MFEKAIPSGKGSKNFIDCYRRGHFVLKAKQGVSEADQSRPLSREKEEQLARRKTGHGKRGTQAWDTALAGYLTRKGRRAAAGIE